MKKVYSLLTMAVIADNGCDSCHVAYNDQLRW